MDESRFNPNTHEVVSPTQDTVSQIAWHRNQNFLAASTWDSKIGLWEIQMNSALKTQFQYSAPILTCCWADMLVFFGSVDGKVGGWDPTTGHKQEIGEHGSGVKFVKWLSSSHLISGSWDSTIKVWDVRAPRTSLFNLNLPNKLYAADVQDNILVCATAGRDVLAYDMRTLNQPIYQKKSPLKFQSKCIKLFNTPDPGFVIGSVEGKAAVEYLNEPTSRNFVFSCHRDNNAIKSVNDIAFHPGGVFATVGSEGGIKWWNKEKKMKVHVMILSMCISEERTFFIDL
eukprot:TRINITY_DN4307_c0_g1_i1.p1 TRINITY_DN4307_c0_g1~~TRINITY_DN4307_c0_g1_i1.p1  ORF type:complete len:285 (-),score=58.07 TRINITY_DN4307_c0_g1_i1:246-1100(-)